MRLLRVLALATLAACGSQDDKGSIPQTQGAGDDGGGTTDGVGEGGGDDTQGCGAFSASITTDAIVGSLPMTANLGVETACGEGDVTEVDWDFGDGGMEVALAPAHTWLASGEFTVTAVVTDESGARTTATRELWVEPQPCPLIDAVVQVGVLQDPELIEASGLVDGRRNAGILWTHNDSGDGPRIFAMEVDGTPRGTFTLVGAPDGDWEDIAIGADPDTGEPLLYVGDVGANGSDRETLVVYLVPEPLVTEGDQAAEISDYGTLDLAFPDGPVLNSDTLMVDPVTQDLYVVALEEDGTSGIYRANAPHVPGSTVTLERVAGVRFGEGDLEGSATPVGGEFSPLGDQILIRTADSAFLWRRDQVEEIDKVWSEAACPLPIAQEVRGEAISVSTDGAGYYTTSEEADQPIWYTTFVPADPPCAGLEAHLQMDAEDYAVPFEPVFSVDERCVPAGIASVSWDFGDGSAASAELSPTHLYLVSGTYTVQLDLTDNDGASAQDSLEFEVLPANCPTVGAAESWGSIESDELAELSGLGASSVNPGVFWAHNDSGDEARLFAMAEDGSHLGTFTLDVSARDWEDMSLGHDAELGSDAIFIGDIGDNGESREEITIHIVPEPLVDLDAEPTTEALTGGHSLTLTYPDGAHNAETLMVDPTNGDLYVVTKDHGGDTTVFRKVAPHVDGSTTTLERVVDLFFGVDPLPGSGAVTGGDFSPTGDLIGIRTYSAAYAWRRELGSTVEEAFATDPCDLEPQSEEQGEALTFIEDGSGYLQVSEGLGATLWFTPLN